MVVPTKGPPVPGQVKQLYPSGEFPPAPGHGWVPEQEPFEHEPAGQHTDPQNVCPAEQLVVQVPFEQVCLTSSRSFRTEFVRKDR